MAIYDKHLLNGDGLSHLISKMKSFARSVISVSDTGTSTDEVHYITVNGVEKKLPGGGTTLTEDDYLTENEIEEIVGSDVVWDGTVE